MTNKSKRIGTQGENRAIYILRTMGLFAKRADEAPIGPREPSWDVWLEDFPWLAIEVKRHKTWNLRAWVRKAIAAFESDDRRQMWAIALIERDRRRQDALPDLVVLPLEAFGYLLGDLNEQLHGKH